MTPENEIAPGRKMNPKQAATLGVVVVIVLIILWQVMGLFGGGSKSAAPVINPAANKPMAAASPVGAMTPPPAGPSAGGNMQMNPNAAPGMAAPVTAEFTAPRQVPIDSNVDILKLEKQIEDKYLETVNQLQLLKLQQAISEANQAIAASKLATMTTEKNIADLLTKPVPVQPSEGSYATNLISAVPSGQQVVPPGISGGPGSQPPPPIAEQPSIPNGTFLVLSVSEIGGRWKAVIGTNGKLYSVSVGDTLDDGSIVIAINKQGVIVEKDNRKRRIPMTNAI